MARDEEQGLCAAAATEGSHTNDRLILHLDESTLAPSDIQRRLGLKHRPTFRTNYLRPALEKGLIEMTRPATPQSRLQQYRLTEPGLRRLRELRN